MTKSQHHGWIRFENTGKSFWQLFLHTLCFCYLPLLIICVVFYFTYYKNVEKNILSAQQENLTNAVSSFEWEMNEITNISNLLAENPTIRRLYINDCEFLTESILLRQTLDSMCSINSLIDDIYLHCPDERWVYSRQGTILTQFFTADSTYDAPHAFTLNGLSFSDMAYDPENLCRFTYALKEYYHGYGMDDQKLLYSAPVYYKSNSISLLSVVSIKTDSVFSYLEDAAKMYDGSILIIMDETNNLVYNSREIDCSVDTLRLSNAKKLHINGNAYYLQHTDSMLGWEIFLLTETSQLPSAFSANMKLFLALLILLLLGSAWMMTHFINRNYAPLHEIYQIAEQCYSQFSDNTLPHLNRKNRDEFQMIHSALDGMRNRVTQLSALQESYSDLLQKEFWMDVINMRAGDPDELYARAAKLNISTENRRWCVTLTEHIANFNGMHELYQKILSDHQIDAEFFLFHSAYAGRHICILSLCADSELQPRDFEHFCYCTIAETDQPLLMGVGQWVEDLNLIAQSNFEAATALDFCRLTGRKVVLFERIDAHFIAVQNPIIDLTSAFRQAIAQENTLALRDVFNSFKKLFIQHDLPLHSLRRMCFELYNVSIDALNSIQKTTSALTKSNFLNSVMNLQFQDDAVDLIEKLEESINECLTPACKPNMDAVLEHLKENHRFADPDFSFTQVANEIGMTNSSFTRTFQKHTGMLPIEYLVELRIDYAKELLEESDLSVVDIAEAVGYYSISSFSKRFKIVTGTTPSEYRLQHKQSSQGT